MEKRTASSVFPFLRSCKEENGNPIKGKVTGEIPKWLKGCLIRIGSGLLEIGPDRFNHVFDGMALMHRFAFKDGEVTYQNRFLRSDTYEKNLKANRIVVSEFGTMGAPDPCKTIFQRFSSLFSLDLTDNDLVNIIVYGNDTFACSETNNIWKIDPQTLDSIQKVNLRNYLPLDGALAHAHEDTDGTIYNIGTAYGFHSCYNVVKFPPKEDQNDNIFENGSVVCKIPASRVLNPAYYHSFAMTENYIILVEQPLYLSILRMAWAHFVSGTYADAMQWNPNTHSCFKVVRRSDGQLLDTNYIATAFFVFHHINAYEEDNHIVLDLCGYPKGDVVMELYVKALEDLFHNPHKYQQPFFSRARRYVLPLNIGTNSKESKQNLVTLSRTEATATLLGEGTVFCEFEVLTGSDPWAPELPRINYNRFNGRKYRYFYAVAKKEKIENTYLLKTDTDTKESIHWTEPGTVPSEPVFVAHPASQTNDEDDGVIVASLLHQDDEQKVSMLVLDARNMNEVGRVTFKAASTVPGDFHGEIPRWLKGCLIRIGSGLLEIGPDRCNHIFDGMALMHRFCFKDGEVTYQNRFLKSDTYMKNMRANRIVVSEFGTMGAPDPCKTIFQRFASLFSLDMTDNDLINIVVYGNDTFACSETNNIWKIDPETLESIQKVDLQNYLPLDGALAHAHQDTDGTIYNIGTTYGFHSYYNVIKFPPKEGKKDNIFENGSIVCKIPASRILNPGYYHSFAMTENYIILVEQPLYFSILRMAWVHFVSGTTSDAINWNTNAHSYFKVVRRSDGKLLDTNYIATAFFVFHHINAYEEDNHIVLDLCGYPKGDVVMELYVKALEEHFHNPQRRQEPFLSRARRYVLPLHIPKNTKEKRQNLVTLSKTEATATLLYDGSVFCEFELLTGSDPWAAELPRINYKRCNGRKYKYFYTMAKKETTEKNYLVNYLLKTDTDTKETIYWTEPGTVPSEPVFVPHPMSETKDEDDGVIIASLLFQNDEQKVSMLVLDARTMKEIGRSTFKTASSVPCDFHGTYIPQE